MKALFTSATVFAVFIFSSTPIFASAQIKAPDLNQAVSTYQKLLPAGTYKGKNCQATVSHGNPDWYEFSVEITAEVHDENGNLVQDRQSFMVYPERQDVLVWSVNQTSIGTILTMISDFAMDPHSLLEEPKRVLAATLLIEKNRLTVNEFRSLHCAIPGLN